MWRKLTSVLLALVLTAALLPAPLAMASSEAKEPAFTDVPADAYYAVPVQWAIANNITSGTTATTFSPDKTCTRCEIVTLLWKTAGCPEPKGASTFPDVPSNAFYAKAAAWAQENGIADGREFKPMENCGREAAMEFIWRYVGRPAARKAPFTDTDAQSVAWAWAQGIVSGSSETTFSPNVTCTRGQIITMLYRALAKDIPWYFLFVIFKNTDISYTDAEGKQIREKTSMPEEEIARINRTGQLFANDLYSMTGGTVYPHVDVLVVDTPITFEDLVHNGGSDAPYNLSVQSVKKKLPDTIQIDAYDHVTAIANAAGETMGGATYLGLGGSDFGQGTGFSFVRNNSEKSALDYFNSEENWTPAIVVHEMLHFLDSWSASRGCYRPTSLHAVAGHKDPYWDFRFGYAAYMAYDYVVMPGDGTDPSIEIDDARDGYPVGIPCAIWRMPPRSYRDAGSAEHMDQADFIGTYEPDFGYDGTGKVPVLSRFPDGLYTGQMWNGKRNGYGRMLYNDGSVYQGNWQDDQPSGLGRIESADGAVYEGEWKNGQRNGWGEMTYADGATYVGEWKDGKREGYGKFDSSEITYAGMWKADVKSGYGYIKWSDGSENDGCLYDGAFENDVPNGSGVMQTKENAAIPGLWKDGKLIRRLDGSAVTNVKGSVYAGQLKDGIREGYGKWYHNGKNYAGVWKDDEISGMIRHTSSGYSYFGYWEDGASNGWGVDTWTGGEIYIGDHQDGKKDGYGTYHWSNGSVYEGSFQDDQRNGFGKYTWRSGDTYTGQWKDGKKDGTGIKICADGRVEAGQWKADRFVGDSSRETVCIAGEDSLYTGQVKDGKRDGIGMLERSDGSIYTGEWSDDKPNGQGIMTYADGTVKTGQWKDGKFAS